MHPQTGCRQEKEATLCLTAPYHYLEVPEPEDSAGQRCALQDPEVIKAVINVLPSIRTRQTELNATADIGQSITLACDADGFPEPAVTWARDGVVLEENDKYAYKDDGSELVIHDVKKVDLGE
ncbi:hypothetical protein AALO_G00032700 [Alosa alosa]|uniref:Ig-like domain-containing protein n=1 Tax=Alosa alosa TaxID=278164 RepID=A0AAV6HCS4_9TELE|nr:hypothetical protein AALO_G00032700 [Alosa alosa]